MDNQQTVLLLALPFLYLVDKQRRSKASPKVKISKYELLAKLDELREDDFTETEIANHFGISVSTLRVICHGLRNPNTTHIVIEHR
jgi:hypothetical protein